MAPDVLSEAERRYEVVDGRRQALPPMRVWASLVATNLLALLGTFVRTGRLGLVAPRTLFRLWPGGPQRRPDVAFVDAARVRTAPPLADDPTVWDVVPNLAVEVLGPTNTAEDVQIKLNEYFRAGVQLVWVIFPRRRQVMSYESLSTVRGFQEPGTLDGGSVLPGFTAELGEVFDDPTRPTTP